MTNVKKFYCLKGLLNSKNVLTRNVFLHAVVAKLIRNIFYIDDTFHDDITIFESEGVIRKTKM